MCSQQPCLEGEERRGESHVTHRESRMEPCVMCHASAEGTEGEYGKERERERIRA